MGYTLTYNNDTKGWVSFYSFLPDMMRGMNSKLYSFKGGNLYRHDSDAVPRNNFYGEQYASQITAFMNDEPYIVKMFKTINIEGSDSWDTSVKTDLDSGYINKEWYKKKEGEYYAYIRNNSNNTNLTKRFMQGVGGAFAVGFSSNELTINFEFDIDSIMSLGDKAFKYNAVSQTTIELGEIVRKTNNSIVISTTTNANNPDVGDFIFYAKDSVAESSGVRGYYMEFVLSNDATEPVELFSIGSSVYQSKT
jgi:hypothetical protein